MTDTHVTVRRSQSGFTLAETLLASVLGAMMLSALALTTYGFTHTLDYMEESAGVNNDADPVLRRMTNEIREAWLVEKPAEKTLDVMDGAGNVSEYSVHDGALWVERPNGDMGKIYEEFEDFVMDVQTVERKREGPVLQHDGIFYEVTTSGAASTVVAAGSSQSIALAFVAPAVPDDVPGQPADDEQLQSVEASVFDLPIAFVNAAGNKKIDFTLYESWAPGKARPLSDPLAMVAINGTSFPAAVSDGAGGWVAPSTTSPVALSKPLTPGVGYTLVIRPEGSSDRVVLKAVAVAPAPSLDEVSKLASGTWSLQPYQVPFDVKGPWSVSSTSVVDVISMVTLTAYPTNRPLQQRSAAVLSQAVSDDPWLGVVPGEQAP